MYMVWKYRYHCLGIKLGFDIPPNVFGKGLLIHHYGSVIVNGNARVGDNCELQQGVVIGVDAKRAGAPVIGNHVYIGAGAKIIGSVMIADGVVIGANAVVNKSFTEKGIVVAGVPAKKIGMLEREWR